MSDEYTMRKGSKSDFLHALQDTVSESWVPLKEVPIGSRLETIYLIDAMAFIQRFQALGASTFGQLQELYFNTIMTNKPAGCQEVHFVGDRYDFGLNSLKGDERQRRGSGHQFPEYIPADSLEIPPVVQPK